MTNMKLSESMRRAVEILSATGVVTIANVRTTTIVALMERGILREYSPRVRGHVRATTRDAVHAEALYANLEHSQERYGWSDEIMSAFRTVLLPA